MRSFSKHYMMTGFRLGYVAAPERVIGAMTDLQSHLCGNVCSFAQYGALAALQMDQYIVEHYRSSLQRRRDIAFDFTDRLFDGIEPAGAFYLFPNIENVLDAAESSEAFALRLIRKPAWPWSPVKHLANRVISASRSAFRGATAHCI